jgi:hypothetical protein
MTTERRKALLMMSATFVAGILIGVLGTGFFARSFYHGHRPTDRKDMPERSRGNFVEKIFQVVKADSGQAKMMRPILESTMAKIDSLQEAGDRDARAVIANMKEKLTPILKPEQLERLEKFTSRKHKQGEERKERGRDHRHD